MGAEGVKILKKMHTRQLLGLRTTLYSCGGTYDFYDMRKYRITGSELKSELDSREHIPNKKESKELRKLRKKRGWK